jgi:O-antigen chain-terminating methyltransferase
MDDFDTFYAAFEERFRGPYATIKVRFKDYIPIVSAAGTGGHLGPVLDLGSGRGEWLELLRDHGMGASGIDQNVHFAEANRRRGLEVEVGDILDVLETKPANHYGAVTAFHVIEHLPPQLQLKLLRGAHRVMKPGGLLILEWPNIENLRVATYSFWLDPTHLHPLPVELVRFMAEFTGFGEIAIERFREGRGVEQSGRPDLFERLSRRLTRTRANNAVTAALNAMLTPGMDVALIAKKPL